jgi:hypothetical protein
MRGEIVKQKITKRKRPRYIKLNPELHQAMQRQLQAFRDKFGRDPEPDDPVFFDDDADAPVPINLDSLQRQIVALMSKARVSPELIYAYCRTGVIATDENYRLLSPEDRDAWERAIAEYSRQRGAE